jgi:hypothetical protein
MKFDPSFTEVYADRDPSSWTEPPIARRAALLTLGRNVNGDAQWAGSTGTHLLSLPTHSVGSPRQHFELWYTAPPGTQVARIMYEGRTAGTLTGWTQEFHTADSDGGATSLVGTPTMDANLRAFNAATPRRQVFFTLDSNTNAVTPTGGTFRRFDKLTVYGSHGLTLRSTGISNDPDGVYASDVVQHIVQEAAPLLTWDPDNPATSYVIHHLAFHDPVTAEDAVLQANKFNLWDWGVYDDRRFFYRPADPDRLTWEARLSDGAHVNLEGDTGDMLFNGAVVQYPDAETGRDLIVGPPGAAVDATDATLQDTDPENPINAHNLGRKWAVLRLSMPTVQRDAIQLGATFLQEKRLPQRRGTITLTGMVRHPTEGMQPVWRVRAGDFVKVPDHPASGPRKIISTSYSHQSRSVTCELDNTRFAVEAILERIGAELVGVI